ncbi:hypothetical protein ILUMI_10999 [Ignelater luminosus]|uniref:Uncharacterized protein n=1 Tax=Ignelater luminosus TaxID=2038154 RepID=A0A8K0GDM4_IGNLU|nr:hypothetical protein ILUMI_10999 [Ignelater luminosus]
MKSGSKVSTLEELPISEKDTADLSDTNSTIIKIAKYLCHTQTIKKSIQLVTEALMAVCDETNRDGFISTKIHSRQQLLHFNIKRDYTLDTN